MSNIYIYYGEERPFGKSLGTLYVENKSKVNRPLVGY